MFYLNNKIIYVLISHFNSSILNIIIVNIKMVISCTLLLMSFILPIYYPILVRILLASLQEYHMVTSCSTLFRLLFFSEEILPAQMPAISFPLNFEHLARFTLFSM